MLNIIQKTKDDYNKIAKHFAATRSRPWPEFSEFIAFLHSGQRILDWGCGSGRLLGSLPKDISYFGIDQSIELIKVARALYAPEIKKGTAHFFCTARGEKKFSQEFFDIVFMIASFFHLPDENSRRALLAKTYRELKAGGRLIMLVWNLDSAWAQEAKAKKGWEKIGPNDFLIPWRNPKGKIEAMRYYHHFSEQELGALVKDAGFSIQKIAYSQGTWRDDKGGRNLIVIATKTKTRR